MASHCRQGKLSRSWGWTWSGQSLDLLSSSHLNIFSKAVEILDSIWWVCEDQPELKDMMGELLHSYNKTSWESMNKYCSLKDKKCYQFYMVAGLWLHLMNQLPSSSRMRIPETLPLQDWTRDQQGKCSNIYYNRFMVFILVIIFNIYYIGLQYCHCWP